MVSLINSFASNPIPIEAEHWRIVPHGAQRGDSVFIGDIAMAATAGGANLCTGGTAFGTNLTGVIANAFDGNVATYCNGSADTADTATFGYEFTAPVSLAQIRLTSTSAGSFYQQMPTGFTVQASIDGGTTWTTQAIITGIPAYTGGAETQSFNFVPATVLTGLGRTNAIGWRVNATADNGLGQVTVSEVIFARTASGAAITGGGFTTSASHNVFVRPPSQAFDGSLSTVWSTNNNPLGRIGRIFDARTNIAEVRIAPDASSLTGGPRDFTIQYTEDGVTWTTASTETSVGSWAASTYKTFAVP